MSWSAHLLDDRGHSEGDWNYTHNCNGMAHTVAEEAGIIFPRDTTPCYAHPVTAEGRLTHYPDGYGSISWWQYLDGMSGSEGAHFLNVIINGLNAEPERFLALNPNNGWGDYNSFLMKLIGMRDAIPAWPTAWSVSG